MIRTTGYKTLRRASIGPKCECCFNFIPLHEQSSNLYVKYQNQDWLTMRKKCIHCERTICCGCMNFCHLCQENTRSGEVICNDCKDERDYTQSTCPFHQYQLCTEHNTSHERNHPNSCVECIFLKNIFS